MTAQLPDDISVNLGVVDLQYPRQDEPGGTGYQPQPGVYDAVVAACNARTHTNDGTAKKNLEWIFKVVDGPNTRAADAKAVGAQLWKYSTFENQAMWVLDMILYALGELSVGPAEQAGKVKFKRSAQVGKPCRVVVEAGTSRDGNTYRAQLKSVHKPGQGQPAQAQAQPADDDPFGSGGTAPAQPAQQPDDEPPF